jgi:hypothetical protein
VSPVSEFDTIEIKVRYDFEPGGRQAPVLHRYEISPRTPPQVNEIRTLFLVLKHEIEIEWGLGDDDPIEHPFPSWAKLHLFKPKNPDVPVPPMPVATLASGFVVSGEHPRKEDSDIWTYITANYEYVLGLDETSNSLGDLQEAEDNDTWPGTRRTHFSDYTGELTISFADADDTAVDLGIPLRVSKEFTDGAEHKLLALMELRKPHRLKLIPTQFIVRSSFFDGRTCRPCQCSWVLLFIWIIFATLLLSTATFLLP